MHRAVSLAELKHSCHLYHARMNDELFHSETNDELYFLPKKRPPDLLISHKIRLKLRQVL